MAVSYDYYRIFYYVGKYHSFTRAAKVLGNSQPNITRSMNNLESEGRPVLEAYYPDSDRKSFDRNLIGNPFDRNLKIILGDSCTKWDDYAGSVKLFACLYDIHKEKGRHMVCAAAGGMAFSVAEERRKRMDIIGLGVRSTYQREASEKSQDRVGGSVFSDYLSVRTHKDQASRDAYVPSVRREVFGCETYRRQGVEEGDTVGDSEESNTNHADREEAGDVSSKTNIIVKPDGSRVLVVTMNIGGMETNMSLKISEPTDMQNDSNSPNNTTQPEQATSYMLDGDMAEN